MTVQYSVSFRYNGKLAGNPGYQFYGVLCERLAPDFAEQLHETEMPLIHQYVKYSNPSQTGLWTVFCYSDAMGIAIENALKEDLFIIHDIPFQITSVQKAQLPEGIDLDTLAEKRFGDSSVFRLKFLTPTTFKQNGEFVIFPSVPLIYHSILTRHELITGSAMTDEDAVKALLQGTQIKAYTLSSSYYPVKGNYIPGFTGQITVSMHLAEPLRLFSRDLLCFGERTGVGAKTALGMGAFQLEDGLPQNRNIN